MQNSRFSNSTSPYSPICNGTGGISKRMQHYVSSTPVTSPTPYIQNSIFSPPRVTPLRSPPRYLLSDVTATRTPTTSNRPTRPIQKISGPLLASTRFNINLGTYTDTKSPGLSTRIVQYNNETKAKHIATHQTKYGSPGLFPIVHFFKKEIPIISPKPKKVTVRIASPDINLYNSKYTRSLSNEMACEIKNGHTNDVHQVDISTKSVLDALKEISRKRIHTSTELEPNEETYKRQRTDCMGNDCGRNKRNREDSPLQESNTRSSPSHPCTKKICVVDVLAASFTSSNLLKEQLEKGLKRKAELEGFEKKEQKQAKLINAGTQTRELYEVQDKLKLLTNHSEKNLSETKLSDIETRKPEKEDCSPKIQTKMSGYVNVFDEKKLEINRKNKLATLLSAITGDTPNLIPYHSPVKEGEKKQIETKLVSIISPQNKPKHDRHVSFNLPPEQETTDEDKTAPTENSSEAEISETQEGTPIIAQEVTTPDKRSQNTNLNSSETPKTISPLPTTKLSFSLNSSAVESETVKSVELTFPNNSVVNLATPVTKSALLSFNETNVTNTLPSTAISSPTSEFSYKFQDRIDTPGPVQSFSFGSMANTPVQLTNLTAKSVEQGFSFGTKQDINSKVDLTTSNKATVGGFKFDLNKTAAKLENMASTVNKLTVASSNMTNPSFSFGTSENTSVDSIKPLLVTTSNQNSNPPLFGAASSANSIVSSAMFGFGSSNVSDKPLFSTPKVTTAIKTQPVFGNNAVSITSASAPTFGISTSSGGALYKTNLSFSASSTPGLFNTTNTTSVLNAASITAPPFGQPSNLLFGGQHSATFEKAPLPSYSTAAAPAFASASTLFNGTTNTSAITHNTGSNSGGGFANNNINNTFTSNIFGSTTATPTFSTGISAAPTFSAGASVAPAFSTATSASSFSAGTSLPAFGSSNSAFGTPITTSTATFGTTTTKATSGFGLQVPSIFATSTTVTPTFGSNSVPSTITFPASVTNTAPFGSLVPKTTTLSSNSVGAPAFGSNNSNASMFGANVANNQGFASHVTNMPTFGVNVTSGSGFGTSNTPKTYNFVPSNSTGLPGFGNNAAPSFNFPVTTSTAIFNSNKSTPSFGSNFGSSSNQVITFGSSQQPATATPTGSANQFGSLSFVNGTSGFSTKPEPGFGTQGGPFANNNVPTFGSTVNNTFSSNTFGNTSEGIQTFGAGFGSSDGSAFAKPQAASGLFGNPGSGDSGFQFGNNIPGAVNNQPAFGSNSANSTAAPASSAVFAFGSNNPPTSVSTANVFAFGSSEAPKPSFNFSSGSNQITAFGTSSPGFGNAPNPTFNPNVSQFTTPAAGMFSIGSGSSTTNRSRTQLKAKRRN